MEGVLPLLILTGVGGFALIVMIGLRFRPQLRRLPLWIPGVLLVASLLLLLMSAFTGNAWNAATFAVLVVQFALLGLVARSRARSGAGRS